MSVRRLDSKGRVMVHGAEYAYESKHPYMPTLVGEVFWDKNGLVYIFVPDNKDYEPVVLNCDVLYADDSFVKLQYPEVYRVYRGKTQAEELLK